MRILRLPGDAARFLWQFINPSRSAGRIPLGRLAIAVQIVGAMIFLGYTLVKKDVRLPFSAQPYEVEVIFPNAKGLDPKDEPSAAVAGTPLGRVTQVRYVNGQAEATLELAPSVRGKIFADASATLRPATALQNLLVNVDPGTPTAGPLPDGRPIPPDRTQSFVAIDELTSVFDADTQAYLQILISQAEQALHGREGALRSGLVKLGKLTDTATPVAKALADRRRMLTELVGNTDKILQTVSQRGRQLGTTIDAGSRTLAVTAQRSRELRALARELAPVVTETQRALAATRRVTTPLAPALDRLAPATRFLRPDARKLRGLLPSANRFIGAADNLTRQGALPLSLLASGTTGLAAKAQGLVPTAKDLSYRAGLIDQYKHGITQLADTWSGAFSVSDNGGIYGQVDVLGTDTLRPQNFGLPASATRSSAGTPSRLETMLAGALEESCRARDPLSCLLRFSIPGLPKQPLTPSQGKGR